MKKMYFRNIIPFSASLLFFFCPPVEAQWPTSPDSAIYVGPGTYKQVVEDGQGGVYIVSGNNHGHCTRINHFGEKVWENVTLDADYHDQYHQSSAITTDSCLIVSYADILFIGGPDWGDAHIRVQKISPQGEKLWGEGVIVTPDDASGSNDTSPHGVISKIVADESGGAFVVWTDFRNDPLGGMSKLFIQRLNSDGDIMWDSLGVYLDDRIVALREFTSTNDYLPSVFYTRKDLNNTMHVHYQRINEEGELNWASQIPEIIGGGVRFMIDQLNNVFIAQDESILKFNIDFQEIWPSEGIAFSDSAYRVREMLPDNEGGVIIQYRKNVNSDLNYSQWMESDGSLKYGLPGLHSLTASGFYTTCTMSDSESYIVTYQDVEQHIGQRIDKYGNLLWPENTQISLYSGYTNHFPEAVSDGSAGILYIFDDGNDIYAKQVGPNGSLGSVTSLSDQPWKHLQTPLKSEVLALYPNPFNSSTTVLTNLNNPGLIHIDIIDLTGRKVATKTQTGKSGINPIRVDMSTYNLSSGIYIFNIRTDQTLEHPVWMKATYIR